MAFTAKVISVVEDGTNVFLEVQLDNGSQTLPMIRPVFPSSTTYADIKTYLDTICTNAPTLSAQYIPLVSKTFTGS